MKVGRPTAIVAIDRVLGVAHLETCCQAGPVRKKFAPVNPEGVTVAVGGVVGQPRYCKLSLAVISLGIADRPRKMTAAKDGAFEIYAAAVGDGLEVGICYAKAYN